MPVCSCAALYLEQQTKAAFWNTADFYGLGELRMCCPPPQRAFVPTRRYSSVIAPADLRSMHEFALKDHFQQPVVGCVWRSRCGRPDLLYLLAEPPCAAMSTQGHFSLRPRRK